jgi:DNA-binding response OmpR family regulator
MHGAAEARALIPNILIVEDDSQTATWLQLHIESIWADCKPRHCRCSEMEAALDDPSTNATDLLLIGLHFGGQRPEASSEFSELRLIRRHHKLLQILVIATSGNELTAVRALHLGANDYLPRERLTPPLLAQRLRAALRRSRLLAAKEQKRSADAMAESEPAPGDATLDDSGASDQPMVPRYTMQKLLGESSRAEVWLALSEDLEKEVAIKISRTAPSDVDEQSLFAREYAAIAALNHPGVVEIYDYGVHDRREYLAMEYFPHGDLKQRMKRQFTPRLSLTYLKRIAEALQPVHAAGLMHLDLKPANIMVRNSGEVVLIDFGLVKHMDSLAGSTVIGVRRGSPHYMSPEQVLGLTLDARSDIYSMGVILYEMLTARRPYQGTTAMELMESHVDEPRPALPRTLERYEALLSLLMAKNRDERFADATALLAYLSQQNVEHSDAPQEPNLAHA